MKQLLLPLMLIIASTGLYGQIDTIQNNEGGYSVRQKLNSVILTINSLSAGYPSDSTWDEITTSIINDQGSGVAIDGTIISNNTIAPSSSNPANYMTANANELAFYITSKVLDIKATGLTFDIRYMTEVTAPGAPSANMGVLYMDDSDEHIYFQNSTTTYDLTQGTGVGGDTIQLGTIAPLNSDTGVVVLVFGGGAGNTGDGAIFTTSAFYGSYHNSSSDTLVARKLNVIMSGGTSPSINLDIEWHATFDSGSATHLNNTPPTITGGTSESTGFVDTTFDNIYILPDQRVWCKTTTVSSAPLYLEVTLTCSKQNNQW